MNNKTNNGYRPGYSIEPGSNSLVHWPAPIGEAGLFGIAGDFVRLAAPHTEADANAILLTFLVYAGNLLGRDYFVPTGADRHCGNIYCCLVGPTAGGRKGSAISAAEQFFVAGDNAVGLPRVIRGISSGEGVIWKVHDAIVKRQLNKKSGTFEDVTVEENEQDKRTIYSLSEFQQNITNMRRPDSILSAILRQAWDKDIIESPSKNSSAKATGAHISMVAGISKEELLLETTANDAQNGTLNRFLFACCKRSKLLPEGESFHKLTQSMEWKELQERFNDNIASNELGSMQIQRTEEAQKDWGLNAYPDEGGIYEKLSQLRPGLWGTVTARAPQQVIRLSLITAIINGKRSIELPHQEAAWEYWRFCDDSCKYIWGDTTDPTAAKILKGLRDTPDGMVKSEIGEMFKWHKSAEELNTALNWLHTRGLIYFQSTTSTGGRPAERWFATL
jgi:hypothetical protein